MKYFTIIILFFFVFSYIDEPCDAGSFGKGVCVEKSSCKLFNKQEGYAYEYVGGAPKWPCPNDPPDVICCVKHLTRLSNGNKEEGRCLNSKHCYSSIYYSGAECPGSENVKVCIEIEKPKGRAYVVNDLVKYLGGNLYIKGYPGGYGDNKGILKYDQYIFATDTNENIVKFYKGYVSEMYLYSVNSEVNYKVNTDRLNFRSGPDTSFDILYTLDYGTKIVYFSRDPWNSDWAVTNKGYCHASFISPINDSTPPIPTPTPTTTPTTTPTPIPTLSGDISTKFEGTLLTRSSFIEKVSSYCKNGKYKIASALCNNAGTVYDISKSSNVNALLVIVRAIVEGNSPGGSTYNFWGIHCFNGQPGKCSSYNSLEEGVRDFADNISKYNNLGEMASKYAFIGYYWFNPGSSGDGGCYYYPHIKQYMSPERSNTVGYICNKSTKCYPPHKGDCTATIDEDQRAYKTWQVEKNMAPRIREIFGVYLDKK